jgi:Mg2+ and Co2+ transporter CorA
MRQINYIKSVLSTWEMRIQDYAKVNVFKQKIQPPAPEIFALRRRISELCDYSQSALDSLGISTTPSRESASSSRLTRNWYDCDDDFRYVNEKMLALKTRAADIVTALHGFIGILEAQLSVEQAQRSLQEAKSVRRVTLLGMFFVPFAITSGLFSLSPNYSPGESKFWVYWVIAIPLVVLVFGVAVYFQGLGIKLQNFGAF